MTRRVIAEHHETRTPIPVHILITELSGAAVEIRVQHTAMIIGQDDWDDLRQQIIANG